MLYLSLLLAPVAASSFSSVYKPKLKDQLRHQLVDLLGASKLNTLESENTENILKSHAGDDLYEFIDVLEQKRTALDSQLTRELSNARSGSTLEETVKWLNVGLEKLNKFLKSRDCSDKCSELRTKLKTAHEQVTATEVTAALPEEAAAVVLAVQKHIGLLTEYDSAVELLGYLTWLQDRLEDHVDGTLTEEVRNLVFEAVKEMEKDGKAAELLKLVKKVEAKLKTKPAVGRAEERLVDQMSTFLGHDALSARSAAFREMKGETIEEMIKNLQADRQEIVTRYSQTEVNLEEVTKEMSAAFKKFEELQKKPDGSAEKRLWTIVRIGLTPSDEEIQAAGKSKEEIKELTELVSTLRNDGPAIIDYVTVGEQVKMLQEIAAAEKAAEMDGLTAEAKFKAIRSLRKLDGMGADEAEAFAKVEEKIKKAKTTKADKKEDEKAAWNKRTIIGVAIGATVFVLGGAVGFLYRNRK